MDTTFFCTDCNTDFHLIHIPTRSFFTNILPFGGEIQTYIFYTGDCCVVEMNTEGKSFHSPCVARIRMAEKGHCKDGGRGRKIVLAGKTNDRRLYPAAAKETSPSFHMTDCSDIHSDCFLHFLTKIQARRRKTLQQKVLNQVCGYHIIIIIIMNV